MPGVDGGGAPPLHPPDHRVGTGRTAAVRWLSAGVHFMQVSKWLGHSSYVLTMTTYADYIPEQEAENPLPEPVAPVANVRKLPACDRNRRKRLSS